MISPKKLHDELTRAIGKVWKEKSVIAKKGRKVELKDIRGKLGIRSVGVRKQLPKTVTDAFIIETVDELIKEEQRKGFIEDNDGDIHYLSEPSVEIMTETWDSKTNKARPLEQPIFATWVDAGYVPHLHKQKNG